MKLGDFFKSSRFLTAAFLFFIPFLLQAQNYVINNEDDIIGQRATDKINEMGEELFRKDGISVYVSLNKTANNISVKEHMNLFVGKLEAPYVLLIMFSEDKIMDIISSSEDIEKKFNKDQILSPVPYHGTIKPLLAVKKDLDNFSAAILNGYADVVEQIAKSDNLELESAIGDANRYTLDYIRAIVYTMFAAALFIYIYRKIRYRHAKKK
ncbi:MAG: TPM domain-containing protein [Campylobacteraceae bacterium]|jgi:hypothetical protein|nr:TPM domain-containing protein [Campylobacteraceae bacterium]